MANNPRIDIGVRVDYKDVLEQMKSNFKRELTEISNHAKKTSFDADIEKKLNQIDAKVDATFGSFEKKFEELGNQTINTENFEKYQEKVSKSFSEIKSDISGVTEEISELSQKIGMLDGSSFAANMKAQFNDLSKSVLDTYNGLRQIIDISKTSSKGVLDVGTAESVERYSKTLNTIKKIRAEIESIANKNIDDDIDIQDEIYGKEDLLDKQIDAYKRLKDEIKNISKSSPEYAKKENQIVRVQLAIEKTIATMQRLNEVWGDRNADDSLLDGSHSKMFSVAEGFGRDIDAFVSKAEKMSQTTKDVKESVDQIQGAFNTFQIKNGAIHIPIDIATKSSDLKNKINEIVEELKTYAKNKPIIAKVKLVLDKSSSKGYVKNSDVDKQQVEGQNEPAVDITRAIQKTYRDAAREAKQIVKTEIAKIQEEFENVPIKIKPDTEAFSKDLKKMINTSFKEIAKETSGVKVNEELEKLVTNLKEVSTSLSGNESFKFGLDEDSIKRITDAIKNMADMIQRAFGVASNDDIAAQWATIESKFKGVAGEEGKLLKGNKEHKIAIQELAVEYKKYIDMGGKNDLSELTTHKQTIKNIAAEYESLGKAAQEAAQQQDKVAKKPASTKVSSEEAEAIKGVTKQNKNLETQAGKTIIALDNEGKSAQSVAGKFRKLAKEKGAAVVANRELAKAAKETADALEREAKARKSGAGKTNANAIDESVYNENYLNWQSDIEKSLKDSGDYAGVYESKISRATDGTVKFTAVVKTLDGELTKFKKFSANVNEIGEIFAPSVSAMKEGQAANFEKDLIKAERIREAIADMFAEGEEEKEPIRLDRTELQLYSDEIQRILKDLEEVSGTSYKLDITSSGRLSIVRSEIAESGAEAEQFAIFIDRIDDIFEETADGIVVSSSKIEAALESAFDGAKISNSFKGIDPTSLNQGELWRYLSAIEKAAHELENADTKYSVSLGSDGTVHITKEIQKANGEVKIFKGEFKDINDLIDTITGSVKDLATALKDGFDSGKVTTKTRNVAKEAQDAFEIFKKSNEGKSGFKYISDDLDKLEQKIKEIKTTDGLEKFNDDIKELRDRLKNLSSAEDVFSKFELKYEGNSNWSKISAEVKELRQNIAVIDSQDKLNEFKQKLSDIAVKLNNIAKDNKLGKLLDENKTFGNINEVRANIDSLFASMGKVNEKSIRITGTDKLTAEVKSANGEIRKMAVSLDSEGFARFVDKGIVEFGRLRSAAEGVFKGIQSMVRIYLSPQDFIRYFRQGFDAVKEIDTAMTELRKVSDASAGDISAYFDTAAASAKELGSSINEMIGATADWSRMGKSLPDSKELAEVAILYKNVGDNIDVEEATSSLVSTLQGFQMDAKDAIKIVDSFNEVA